MDPNPNHGLLRKVATYPRLDAIGAKEIPGKGRGVVALHDIAKGDLIERAPMLVIPHQDRPAVDRTIVFTYLFVWEPGRPQQTLYEHRGRAAIVLGLGSLLNHAAHPNAGYSANMDDLEIEFRALRDIAAGEEVTIDYDIELWFDPV